ncbi:MAG: PLP-dependent aspartate aminotransferase family protein [Oligoflexia bacterium]|nr:PLP-dependent aspartate aminotransferase family protein [Oligoflexia bacterium]
MKRDTDASELGYATKAVHAGQRPNQITGAVVEPIYQCSVYAQEFPGKFKYDYGRSMNPNYYPLEEALAAIELGKFATVLSSGVGAMTALMFLFKAGDRVIIPTDLYGGTYRLFKQVFEKYGLQYTQIDLSDLNAVEDALRTKPALLYIESPTNPLLTVYDLKALANLAGKYQVLTAVDNTFASPYCQNPLTLGIDIVLHSCSKYIGGHSDIVGGAIMTNHADVREKMDFARKAMGLHADPMTMFLMRRGIKTLPLRVEKQQKNAMALATFLEKHPKVERVLYPGLPSHPQHEIAKRQMKGFAGMISVYFKLGHEETMKLISSFDIITLAESLGAVESLVEHPASMTHQKIPAEVRRKNGLSDGLVRFSMGIEDERDLINDVSKALEKF